MARKSTGKSLRFDVFHRDAFTCRYCGAQPPAVVLVIDHVLPVAQGGGNGIDNLVTACEPCNQGKAAKLLADAPPAPDADLLYLKAQQEIGEMRRYQEALRARESSLEDVVADLQGLWSSCSGLEWVPAGWFVRQMLTKYEPEVVEEAIRETGWRVMAGYVKENKWQAYMYGVARKFVGED